ncbi:MAG TPA: 50S ribosomal protein L11 methyltransferase, partial [Burkholderiaceae bacterium]|nr:50S ribosomal protein L11 methyltransferase [Burkholderiaceae bacterium]
MLVEITLSADDLCAEALADALLESGALSVSTEDAHADTPDEQPLYGEPGLEPACHAWARSRLRVLAEPDRIDAIVEAASLATKMPLMVERRTAVEDTDWVRATQSQFTPTRISDRLWIVPTWHQPPQPD